MRKNLGHVFLLLSIVLVGCLDSDDDISTSPNLRIQVSSDTITFDTLLTERLSLTRRLRIYNPNQEGVQMNIGLATASSPYEILVNGKEGPWINDELGLPHVPHIHGLNRVNNG